MKPISFELDVVWTLEGGFADNSYSRGHVWRFDGGVEVPASASPHVVPLPQSVEAAVDPEEAYLAAISSCHMLWFLDLARRDGWVVESYRDHAAGRMVRGGDGRIWVDRAELTVVARFAGVPPESAQLDDLHHRAHEACFIANSIRTEIVVHSIAA